MIKYEFKKFPIAATVLTLISLLAAVLAISISLMTYDYDGGIVVLALFIITGAVLVLAGLTTAKVVLLKVISIIITIGVVIASFFLAIVKYSSHDVFLFSTSILMFIASVLGLVYFVNMRNDRIKKMHAIAAIAFSSLTGIYAIIYIVFDIIKVVKATEYSLHPQFYALIIAFMLVAILPYVVNKSLTPIEEKVDEPYDEEVEPEQEAN